MKKCSALILVFTLVLAMLAGCGADGGTPQSGAQSQPVSASDNTAQTSVPQGQTFDEPELNITEVYGLGPNGETAGSSLDLTFTEDELAQLKDGGFKVGVSMHMLNNASNTIKIDVMKGILAERGVEVVATTDAQLDPAKMVSDMESIMVMEPDVIVSCVADPISNKPIFEQARDAGIKLVFSEIPPDGFVGGEDYVALVSGDYVGNGRFAAEYMAYLLGYEGTVGVVFTDMNFWTCNYRDQAFRDTMAQYPDITIVAEAGFADINLAGTAADGILANYPDVDAIYATWDDPAELVAASAIASGRSDLIITTTDLGDNVARVIAENGLVKAVGSPSFTADGQALADAVCYALLGKEVPATYIATPTVGVTRTNVLEAYSKIYDAEPPAALVAAYEAAD